MAVHTHTHTRGLTTIPINPVVQQKSKMVDKNVSGAAHLLGLQRTACMAETRNLLGRKVELLRLCHIYIYIYMVTPSDKRTPAESEGLPNLWMLRTREVDHGGGGEHIYIYM